MRALPNRGVKTPVRMTDQQVDSAVSLFAPVCTIVLARTVHANKFPVLMVAVASIWMRYRRVSDWAVQLSKN